MTKNCKHCGKEFKPRNKFVNNCTECIKDKYKYCSMHDITYKNNKCPKCEIENSHIKFNETNLDDWIECTICGIRAGDLASHLRIQHQLKSKEYNEKFNGNGVKCKKELERMLNNNPGANHGGRLSSKSVKFLYYEERGGEEYRKDEVQKMIEGRTDASYNTKPEFYMKGLGCSYEDALIHVQERQRISLLSNYIKKHGEIEGSRKWATTLNKRLINQYSKNIVVEDSNEIVLWGDKPTDEIGYFYFLYLGDNYYKIGASRFNVAERYYRIDNYYKILIENKLALNHAFQIEQILLKVLSDYGICKDESIDGFGWTETFKLDENMIGDLSELMNIYSQSYENTLKNFKKEYHV